MVGSNRADFVTHKALPYDAEIEYLGSDGDQYLDSGITTDNTIECEIDMMVTSVYGSQGVFSARNYPNASSGRDKFSLSIWSNGSKLALNDINYDSGWKGSISLNTRFVTSIKQRGLYMNDTLLASSGSTSTFSFDVTIGILRCHVLNDEWDTRKGNGIRIYGCKIWKDGSLVRNFKPVRVGQVGYLYDKVGGQLFGNEGTGSFTLGPDKT